jgi:three-Cys-motif partner protein
MADTLPTIWDVTAHTLAKHQILDTYLKAWTPIMSSQSVRLGVSGTELLFVDGFAGPGRYGGGQDGSPILAIKSILSHSHDLKVPIRFLFIELDKERHGILRDAIKPYEEQAARSGRISSIRLKQGDCETVLNKMLDDLEKEKRKVGPALFFLDQSGYSDVSMELIRRIMSQPLCEVFFYLNWDHMNRFLVDQTKWPSLSMTFGGDDWRPVLSLEMTERPTFILQTYRTALKQKASIKYVWHFVMCDSNGKLLYWLFFCTNSLRGLEKMKKAMWRVDPTGGFRFSDKNNPSQLSLFENYTDNMLIEDLFTSLRGRKMTVAHVKEFVLTETPAYLYKNALNILEKQNKLTVPNPPAGRRKGTFPDEYMNEMFVQFLN